MAQQHLRLQRIAPRVPGSREQQSIAQLCAALGRALIRFARCSEDLRLLGGRRLCQPLHGLKCVTDEHCGGHVTVIAG